MAQPIKPAAFQDQKPALKAVADLMTALAGAIPYFPQDPMAIALVTHEVHKFVGTNEQLEWFSHACVGKLLKYEGVPMLRAIFCLKYRPADGEDPICDVPGIDENVMEANFRRREMDENDRRLEAYKRAAELAPAEDRAPFQLPAGNALPEATAVDRAAAREFVEDNSLTLAIPAPDLMPIPGVVVPIVCRWCEVGEPCIETEGLGLNGEKLWLHPTTPVGRQVCKTPPKK